MRSKATICCIRQRNKVLLKMANRGISKGYWNFAGGKIEPHETPKQNIIREVFEETGLRLHTVQENGRMTIHNMPKGQHTIYLYSSCGYIGSLKSTEEGKVKWFNIKKMPFDEMWDTARYVIPPILNGEKFEAHFYLNRRKKVLKYEIKSSNGHRN